MPCFLEIWKSVVNYNFRVNNIYFSTRQVLKFFVKTAKISFIIGQGLPIQSLSRASSRRFSRPIVDQRNSSRHPKSRGFCSVSHRGWIPLVEKISGRGSMTSPDHMALRSWLDVFDGAFHRSHVKTKKRIIIIAGSGGAMASIEGMLINYKHIVGGGDRGTLHIWCSIFFFIHQNIFWKYYIYACYLTKA